MTFDILREVESIAKEIINLAEENWQLAIGLVFIGFAAIIYLIFFR